MNEKLLEGFEFSKKSQRGGGVRTTKDVGISYQRNGKQIGLCIRNDLSDLIAGVEKPYIRLAQKRNLLYFIPTDKYEGYALRVSGGKGHETIHTKYAAIKTVNMPSSFEKFFEYKSADFDMKFDKNLELYYIDLFEGEIHG